MRQPLPLLLVTALAACHAPPSEPAPKPVEVTFMEDLPLADLAASAASSLEALGIEVRIQAVRDKTATISGTSLNGAAVMVEFEAMTPDATHLTVQVTGKPYGRWLAGTAGRRIVRAAKDRVRSRSQSER